MRNTRSSSAARTILPGCQPLPHLLGREHHQPPRFALADLAQVIAGRGPKGNLVPRLQSQRRQLQAVLHTTMIGGRLAQRPRQANRQPAAPAAGDR